MKTYKAISHSWARLPKKLPGNWLKLLFAPAKPKPLPLPPRYTRYTLEEFKQKLDIVLKPLGFSATKCEYDIRNYLVLVHMVHVFPKHREHVVEWKEPDHRTVYRNTPVTIDALPKTTVIEPEAWQCVFKISEEQFAYEDHKPLLQQCCRYVVDSFTNHQLTKVGA